MTMMESKGSTIMKSKTKIGIFGGTFDPIHNGHLYIAENARLKHKLSKVIFMPSAIPPHKQTKHISEASHRLEMCNLATQENEYFEVSDLEIKRKGLSYTVETLKQLKDLYGENFQIYFICGADMLADMPNWYKASDLLANNNFIAVARPSYSLKEIVKNSTLLQKNIANLSLINLMPIKISSTGIRNNIKDGKSIKYLLPNKVEIYIEKNNLY